MHVNLVSQIIVCLSTSKMYHFLLSSYPLLIICFALDLMLLKRGFRLGLGHLQAPLSLSLFMHAFSAFDIDHQQKVHLRIGRFVSTSYLTSVTLKIVNTDKMLCQSLICPLIIKKIVVLY